MYIRIRHPITGRFIGEYDHQRQILLVVDRKRQGLIDLAREWENALGTAVAQSDLPPGAAELT